MTVVHIVLVKLKAEVKDGSSFKALKEQCDALYQHPEINSLAKEMKGYDWGLYSVFEDADKLATYRDHPVHQDFVRDVVVKNTDDLLAYDFEV